MSEEPEVTQEMIEARMHIYAGSPSTISSEYAELLAKCEAFFKEEDARIEEIKKFFEGSQWPPTKE